MVDLTLRFYTIDLNQFDRGVPAACLPVRETATGNWHPIEKIRHERMKPGIEALAALPLFASFRASQIAALNDLADLARLGPDEVLFREGDQMAELNILLAGFVTETHCKNGANALTDVIGPVMPIGFASAMLGAASPTGARTITSARLIIIPAADLRVMIRAKPALALPFLDHALAGMRAQTLELCSMKLRSSVQRLAGYLLGLVEDPQMSPSRFVLPFEKRFLAAKIGCTQENLSRAFAALRSRGVETQQAVVVLRDVPGLRAFAGLPEPARNAA
jgi:CRP-like cAMP-binding protein